MATIIEDTNHALHTYPRRFPFYFSNHMHFQIFF